MTAALAAFSRGTWVESGVDEGEGGGNQGAAPGVPGAPGVGAPGVGTPVMGEEGEAALTPAELAAGETAEGEKFGGGVRRQGRKCLCG